MSASKTPILETQKLTFRFGGNLVVNQVSLQVQPAEFLSIIGPNGAGKTTFFNLLSGLYRPSAGYILYRGQDITRTSAADRARSGIARSFQLTNVFPNLTVHENCRLAAQAQGRGSYQLLRPFTTYRAYLERADAALELVGLTQQRGAIASSLSHGDKRKLELAIVLAMDPQVLLLDEPTSGVSIEDVPTLIELIRHIRQVERKTILMVEHKMSAVLSLSDRVAVLHSGKLLAVDTPARIRDNEIVQAAYLGREGQA
jgi:branched-chain amino acid transport system ATP-binding protein